MYPTLFSFLSFALAIGDIFWFCTHFRVGFSISVKTGNKALSCLYSLKPVLTQMNKSLYLGGYLVLVWLHFSKEGGDEHSLCVLFMS